MDASDIERVFTERTFGTRRSSVAKTGFVRLAAVAIAFAQAAEAYAAKIAVGDQLTLWELTQPDRFGWPAIFTCRRQPGDTNPVVVSANDPSDLNERLLAARTWPQDCHGGFSIRSIRKRAGKIMQIEGQVQGLDTGKGETFESVHER